jgi:hypothetical protein
MSRAMEDRLRAAYQAKAAQVTDERLAQLHSERDEQLTALQSDDADVTRLSSAILHPDASDRIAEHSRWFAPALAAAVIAAVAAGAVAVANSHGPRQVRPAPPASHVSSPTGTPTPTAKSTSASQPPATATGAAPAYLARGKTGSRADVPWSAVGSGWRLMQPHDAHDAMTPELYLYDPAGGRYLISDQLPGSAKLVAWSPDGQRAMLQSTDSNTDRFQQLDLRSGQLDAGFTQYVGSFVSYTQPRGLAVLVEGTVQGALRLLRYGADGTLQLVYPPTVDGSVLISKALYTADGSQFVGNAGGVRAVLMTNSGQLVRSYPFSQASDRSCIPLRWWTSDTFLEMCDHNQPDSYSLALYLQPIDGSTPSRLIDQDPIQMNYDNAWPLSNGDVLLDKDTGCGVSRYDILRADGAVVPFVWPAGVPDSARIVNMSGDIATFQVAKSGSSCAISQNQNVSLIDYNMVTGATSTLLQSNATLLSYPSDR